MLVPSNTLIFMSNSEMELSSYRLNFLLHLLKLYVKQSDIHIIMIIK
jgi:hypothetical protein